METLTLEQPQPIAIADIEGSAMKTCANCGEMRNPGDARFCATCGTPLTSPAPVPPDETGDERPETPAAPAAAFAQESGEASPFDQRNLPAAGHTGRPSQESRYWAIAAHGSALVGGFMGGIPAFLGPLVVWLVRKDDDAWSAGHGRDALNFNLSVIAYAIGLLLIAIVTLGVGLLIAIPGWIFLALGWFAMTIVGAIKAASDQSFRYPLTIRFVK